jgi:hypothetical protein
MPRSRFLRATLMLLLMGAVIYVIISLYLPSPRRLIFGVDKRNGHVRRISSTASALISAATPRSATASSASSRRTRCR